jgi:Tol biopolymer transport system component
VQVSNDGNLVAITTLATNPTGGDAFVDFDVYVKNLTTGAVERISRAANGGEPLKANGQQADSAATDISATGRFVTFQSDAVNLVGGDVDNGELHVWWHDRETGETRRVSESAAGTPGNADHLNSFASVSADGRFVAFASDANNLVANDTNTVPDILVKDMATGAIAFVNRNAAGADITGTGGPFTARQRPQISDDGQFVVFDGSGDVFFTPNPLFPAPDLTGFGA